MSHRSAWIDFRSRDHKCFIQEYPRAYTSLRGLAYPALQQSQMIMLLGGAQKSEMSRSLFLNQVRTGHNKIHLYLSPTQAESHHPLVLADCELHNAYSFNKKLFSFYRDVEEHPLRWHRNMLGECDPSTLASLVYIHVMLPFATTLCFFADDFGGTRHVAGVLSSWIVTLISRSPAVAPSALPRILILSEWDNAEATFDEKLATMAFMRELREETELRDKSFTQIRAGQLRPHEFDDLLKQHFSGVRVLSLPLSADALHFHKLRSRILQESQEVQSLRLAANIAFSAHHFQSFMHSACVHFATDIVTPFNFIRTTRISNPVPSDFSKHINKFLGLVPSKLALSVGLPIVASALAMDSHPPNMHAFEPSEVFSDLYSHILKDIVPKHNRDRDFIRQKIETKFCSLLLATRGTGVACAHKELLRYHGKFWKDIHSMSTCLSCLARQPSYAFPCRHTLCESCIVIHGKATLGEPWAFFFDVCPLCQSPATRSFSLKPPTAGVRGLTIDGGGIQDALILEKLEKRMQLPFDIRRHFDIAIGSGLGALLLLEIFCKEWPVDYCVRHSQTLNPVVLGEGARQFDNAASDGKDRLVKKLLRPLQEHRRSISRNAAITSSLKASFGQKLPLFQCSTSAKITIAAVTSETNARCTFSNYSLPELVRSDKPDNELSLWELARVAISETPFLGYKAREFNGSNELVDTTFWDQDSLWSRAHRPLDRLLCLGSPPQAPACADHDWISDCRLQNQQGLIDITADSLLASLFYIELIELPELGDHGAVCKLQILCRISPSPAYNAWVNQLRKAKARFSCYGRSISCIDRQVYKEASQAIPFSRYIELLAPSLRSVIDIRLVGLPSGEYSISNCPYTVQALIEDQGLHCVFGHRDHQDRFGFELIERM